MAFSVTSLSIVFHLHPDEKGLLLGCESKVPIGLLLGCESKVPIGRGPVQLLRIKFNRYNNKRENQKNTTLSEVPKFNRKS